MQTGYILSEWLKIGANGVLKVKENLNFFRQGNDSPVDPLRKTQGLKKRSNKACGYFPQLGKPKKSSLFHKDNKPRQIKLANLPMD